MMGENNRNKYIDLQIEGTGIKIEDTKNFEKSYYSYEYERAFRVLSSIIKKDSHNKDSLNKDESYNIIAFVGTRGTGKSSAMESFAHALENMCDSSENDSFLPKSLEELRDYSFYTLPSIDGSLLEPQEDIFMVTLGQMYGKLSGLNNKKPVSQTTQRILEYKKREVQQTFEKLIRSARRLEQADGNIEESTIVSLKDLSHSLKLRKDFREFVEVYLDLICEMETTPPERKCKKRYLVILIDDLDMNILHGYEMLEKIHRYLMVPGVIILMTMDFIQLKMLCEGSFYEMVPKVNKILKARQGHISKLATEYTDKVLPIDSRIYMPDFKHMTNVRISISKGNNTKSTPLILKNYFFLELYKKSGMRFDHMGEKWHFYIPETLRATANFSLMLNQLDNLNKHDDAIREWDTEDWTTFESNYTYLIGDIHSRMVVEKLNTNQQEQFQIWSDNQLERTCMSVVNYVSLLAKRGSEEEKEQLKNFRHDYLTFDYSYGELLRSIYLWGRTFNPNKSNSNKKIVHCILADLTAQMTRIYYRMLQFELENPTRKPDVEDSNSYRKRLRHILNGSMLGSWSNRMLPEFDAAGVRSVGALKNVSMNRIRFNFDISKIKFCSPEYILKNNDLIEECRKIFRTMEFFALFYSDRIYKSTPTMDWKLDRLKDQESENTNLPGPLGTAVALSNHIFVYFETGNPSFNMYGFMANLLDWKSKSINLENTLYNCLFLKEGEDESQKNNDEEYFNIRKKFLKKMGVQNEMDEWHAISGGFVLPFYSVDITYNILKRMRQDRYGHFMPAQSASGIYSYFVETLNILFKRLQESDNNYGISSRDFLKGNGVCPSFSVRFKECPFIKWAKSPEKYLVSNFSSIFEAMLSSLVTSKDFDSNSNNQRIEDEMAD